MLHEAFCRSRLSAEPERETSAALRQGENIYSYWQAATNTAPLPGEVCVVIPATHPSFTWDTGRHTVPGCRARHRALAEGRFAFVS